MLRHIGFYLLLDKENILRFYTLTTRNDTKTFWQILLRFFNKNHNVSLLLERQTPDDTRSQHLLNIIICLLVDIYTTVTVLMQFIIRNG